MKNKSSQISYQVKKKTKLKCPRHKSQSRRAIHHDTQLRAVRKYTSTVRVGPASQREKCELLLKMASQSETHCCADNDIQRCDASCHSCRSAREIIMAGKVACVRKYRSLCTFVMILWVWTDYIIFILLLFAWFYVRW